MSGSLSLADEDLHVSRRDRSPALALQRARHHGGSALRVPVTDEGVDELHEVVR